MKKITPTLVAFFVALLLVFVLSSCNKSIPNDPLLKKALELAGDNRKELEKTLNHYSSTNDSLKYKAAVFLIKYMPGKYAKVFPDYDIYKPVFDTIESLNSWYEKVYKPDHAEFYKFYKKSVVDFFLKKHHIRRSSELSYEIKNDVQNITANYLIENIDYAFMAWTMPWNKTLTFDDFCEYILPYRYGTEELTPWRKIYYEQNVHILDSFRTERDPVKVCLALKGLHDVSRSELAGLKGLSNSIKPLDLIRINTTTSCKDESGVVLLKLRGLGIPLARLTFPNWGNWGSGHAINGIMMSDKQWFPLGCGNDVRRYMPPPKFKVAKMFVETYSYKPNSGYVSESGSSSEETPTNIDVTNCITKVKDISIPVANKKNDTSAYLCVFTDNWTPIAFSKIYNNKAVFHQVGQEIIYCVGTQSVDGIKMEFGPFLLDSTGMVKKIVPSKESSTITLFRKYPPNDDLIQKLQSFKGCYFEGSNDSLFATKKVLWKIDLLTSLHKVKKQLTHSSYQYVRLVFPNITRSNEALGGIQFYSKKDPTTPLAGQPISAVKASQIFYNNAFDNNLLTFDQMYTRNNVDFNQFYDSENLVIPDNKPFWIGLKFDGSYDIDAIELSPRTDDNDVNRGETYELFYWKDDGWISLGQKTALANEVKFTAPKNALLLLKNANKGKEHRLFLYQNNSQVWY